MGTKHLNIVSDWLKLCVLICGIVSALIGIGWATYGVPRVDDRIEKKLVPIQKKLRHINYIATKAVLLQEQKSTPEERDRVDRQLKDLNLKP